ncbi:glycosyltransferase family 4 protein [Chlorogloeopsis sp. ULAP02]|uniref:glycosyltransferase family 4 protein n=1 Tax=Chlorogloeopsis sp. ULAP02 TaxID=3107926 RepID=UPI00313524A7
MKIIYVTTELSTGTGGGEKMLYNLLSKINRSRFSPVVVSLMDRGIWGDSIEALGIPVHTLGMKPGKPTPEATWQLIRTVRQHNPNLIQGWMYHGNFAAQLASAFLFKKIAILWNIQCSLDSLADLDNKMTATLVKGCAYLSKLTTKIVFVSQTSKVQHEALGYCQQKSYVIPNSCDTSLFKPSFEAKSSVRSELGLSENTLLIGLMGRYHPMKDHANFLQAAAILLKEYSHTHFLLAGSGVNPENNTLQNLIQDLRIGDRIHLLGHRSDMPRLNAAVDIATSSSAFGEGWSLVIGEAMSCGVPCVVTNVSDAAWIVGNTGRVVPPKNSEALAQAWKELIDIGSKGREALGKAARTRIIEHFSLDSVVAQYEALYESVLSHNKLFENFVVN